MTIVQLKCRRGTSSQWASANPVLAAGEPGFDTTTKELKIGDGTLTWASLPVITGSTSGGTTTFTSASVTDFTEAAQDAVGPNIVGGAGVNVIYDDTTGQINVFADNTSGGSIGLTDNFDGTATLAVSDGNPPTIQAPTASLVVTPPSGSTPLLVTADASGSSDPQAQALVYSYNWGDGTATTSFSTNTAPTHTYNSAGTFTITVTVRNTSLLTDIATDSVTVGSVVTPPVARIVVTPSSGTIPLVVDANASTSTDPGGLALQYSFNWNDGSAVTAFSSTPTASHTYTTAGTWRPVVTARNSSLSTSTATATVTATSAAAKMEMGFSAMDNVRSTAKDDATRALGAPVGTVGWNGATLAASTKPKATRGPFYSALPSTWTNTQPRMVANAAMPTGFARVYVSFTSVTSTTASYAASAPAGTRFMFVHEVEPSDNTTNKGYPTGASYITAYRTARNALKNANPNVQVGIASASYAYRAAGLPDVLAGNYLPAASECDFYGVDCYQGDQNNPTVYPAAQPVQPLSVHTKFQNWYKAMLIKNPKGVNQKPWGLTEYGINFELTWLGVQTNGLDAERANVIPQDAAWLTSQGCSFWLYWFYTHSQNGDYTQGTREFTDQASISAWRKVVADNN